MYEKRDGREVTMEEAKIQENKMGVMPVNRLLLNMAVPMMISMLVQALYNIVDSNNVYNNSCSGIKLVRTGLGNIIVNNICTDNAYNQMGAKSSGIDIEPLAVETENLGYIDGLGSNWNVVLNNTVTGSHDFGVFIADDDTANNGGSSCENVIMYNKFSSAYTFGAADFSSMSSTVKNNITLN